MASPKPTVTLRLATHDDVPIMTEIHLNAFEHTVLNQRSFPSSEPEVRTYWADWIESKMNDIDTDMVVALIPHPAPNSAPVIVGWARWVRVPSGSLSGPLTVFSADAYPSCGDGAVAARFFQAANYARRRVMGDRDHWFLSMIVTRTNVQRNGVGSALMQYGVEKADEDGWVSYLNASEDGKPIYDLFGFKSVEQTSFDDLGQVMYHMTREPKATPL